MELLAFFFTFRTAKTDQMIKDKCNGENFCELEAANEIYGNPCGVTHKYLQVDFHCQAGKVIGKNMF